MLILEVFPVKYDNSDAIHFTKNVVLNSRDKHIEVRHHLISDHVKKRECILEFVSSSNQLTYIFTKPLPKKNLFFIRTELEILNQSCMD